MDSDSGKGKSKIEINESESESESDFCCGICMAESGKRGEIIRGCIDSCDHFFCFLCIMEWSKVESKCPMCKRRFNTIRRPPKPPVFDSERVVQVPIRDQVHYPFGNVTTGPSDPYAEVKCNVCHSSVDEYLLLLCDLCDSASHTYCVGFGNIVPDGDWFCSDCSLMRTEHAKIDSEGGDSDNNQPKFVACVQTAPTGEHVSIFDIVREEPQTSHVEELASDFLNSSNTPPRADTAERETPSSDVNEVAPSRTNLPAKTLWRCRSVHDHINFIRENWDGIRNGSVSFPSIQNHESGGCSGEPLSDSSERQTLTSRARPLSKSNDKRSNEIDKAWRMSNIAKKMVSKREGPKNSRSSQASKHISQKTNGVGHTTSASSHRQQLGSNHVGHISRESSHHYSISQRTNGVEHSISVSSQRQHSTSVPSRRQQLCSNQVGQVKRGNYVFDMNQSQMSGKRQKQENTTLRMSSNVKECFPERMNTSMEAGRGHSNSLSLCRQDTGFDRVGNVSSRSSLEKVYHMNRSQVSGQQQKRESVTLKGPSNIDECFPSMGSAQTVSSVGHAKEGLFLASSTDKGNTPKGKVGPEKNDGHGKTKVENEAKSEIQSLVKVNLKILSKNDRLEKQKFKEIARLATHSILAACGLEPKRSGFPSFPDCICIHVNGAREVKRSTLMPNSCRECFYTFVKDVVYAIMSERKGQS